MSGPSVDLDLASLSRSILAELSAGYIIVVTRLVTVLKQAEVWLDDF